MAKNDYSIKISPLTPQELEKLGGRGEGVLFWQGTFKDEDWKNCSFYHCRFEDVSFLHNLMQGINFFSNVFKNVSFKGCALSGVMFNCALLEDVDFTEADLSGVSFHKARLINCNFTKAQLEGINFHGATLLNCNFNAVDLSQVNLFQVDSLSGTTFNQLSKLPFSNMEAKVKGMVYKPTHLQVVPNGNVPPQAEVIPLPVKKKTVPVTQEESKTPGQVINLVDYFSPKPTGDDGPRIA